MSREFYHRLSKLEKKVIRNQDKVYFFEQVERDSTALSIGYKCTKDENGNTEFFENGTSIPAVKLENCICFIEDVTE
ncbi:MAG: hypothetical protein IPK06_06215 [Ignavibacteriae bacterium]|nr:hypothetical protein [Ignavibacteriota bacterium]